MPKSRKKPRVKHGLLTKGILLRLSPEMLKSLDAEVARVGQPDTRCSIIRRAISRYLDATRSARAEMAAHYEQMKRDRERDD